MKSTTYFVKITSQEAEKNLSEGRKLGSTCLPALLRVIEEIFCEFTEKCFVNFDQSIVPFMV